MLHAGLITKGTERVARKRPSRGSERERGRESRRGDDYSPDYAKDNLPLTLPRALPRPTYISSVERERQRRPSRAGVCVCEREKDGKAAAVSDLEERDNAAAAALEARQRASIARPRAGGRGGGDPRCLSAAGRVSDSLALLSSLSLPRARRRARTRARVI